MSRLKRLADALDERLGWRAAARATLHRPLRPSIAYSLGAALLFALVLQVVTGITLAAHFAPTTTDAWGSVWAIEHQVVMGSYVRGLHHFGASAVVVMCVLHMIQVVAFGAYKRPREGNWLIGILMLGLVLALALTGYLLPWDQHGYWSTQVATGIMGEVPLGGLVQTMLVGGGELGTTTLTRFYALHTLVLPVLLGGLVLLHLALWIKHGPRPRPHRPDAVVVGTARPLWPYQVVRDLVVAIVLFGVLTALALTVGATLEAPADPASDFQARPMWYFRFLYQLLKLFEGPLVIVGTTILPALVGLYLVAVPWLDRKSPTSEGPSRRVWIPLALVLVTVIGLTAWSYIADANDEAFQQAQVEAAADARRAKELAASGGIDGAGRVVLFEGHRLYEEKGCASCHDDPEEAAPRLAGWGTLERFHAFLSDPDAPRFFAGTPFEEGMPKTKLALAQAEALLAYLRDPPSSEAGRRTFLDEDCSSCHNLPTADPRTKAWDPRIEGPDLLGYATYEWTRGLIRDASHPAYFGDAYAPADADRVMPAYPDLGPDELDLLVRWLQAGAPGAR
ncbi:MAG: cytochrome b N-terminal domain-containing protein [Deltaproteobacteria bacterium]|nr:cytochrome b N-terminal domain-containing protein [Deltaproteobacteria bacterium]